MESDVFSLVTHSTKFANEDHNHVKKINSSEVFSSKMNNIVSVMIDLSFQSYFTANILFWSHKAS